MPLRPLTGAIGGPDSEPYRGCQGPAVAPMTSGLGWLRLRYSRALFRRLILEHRLVLSRTTRLQRFRGDDHHASWTNGACDGGTESGRSIEALQLIGSDLHRSARTGILELDPMLAGLVPGFEHIGHAAAERTAHMDRRRSDLLATLHDDRALVGRADDDRDQIVGAGRHRIPFISSLAKRGLLHVRLLGLHKARSLRRGRKHWNAGDHHRHPEAGCAEQQLG